MILSTISTSSIEEVARAAPKLTKWFQLYIYKDRSVTKSLVKRAENAGFKGLVVTVDTPFFGTRIADSRNNFNLPPHLTLANFDSDKAIMTNKDSEKSGLNEYANSLFDASLTWKDIQWLSGITTLPIIVKGILTQEDALEAVKHGVKGIIVSNHGARQLDHVPATIEVLKEIVDAVNDLDDRVEVYVDGGFRTGTDILKAIALGARGVFVGRPIVYGIAVNGQEGVQNVIEILRKEFDQAVALSGCSSLKDVRETKNLVVRKEWFSSKL
jgi:(S)-2-hydroxy-acid oxidase